MIKFIQINIYKGKYLDSLLSFLKKENADFVSCQEVSSGEVSYGDKNMDLFETIKKETGMFGYFEQDQEFPEEIKATTGNAVFSKYEIIDKKRLVINKFRKVSPEEYEDPKFFPFMAKFLVDSTVKAFGRNIHIMSFHGAWTAPPTDTPETLRQANVLAGYLSALREPFILGLDFNNIPESKTVKIVDSVAVNLMQGSGVLQTTHPKIHKIVPRGYLIDYIFTSKDFVLKKLSVPEIIVSDHLPVIAQLEFAS